MKITVKRDGLSYEVNLSQGIDCGSTFGDEKREPSAWYVNPVRIEPVKMDDWTGSVAQGSSVNFYEVQLNPHGNGTHTECYGHIDKGHQKLNDHLKETHGWIYFQRLPIRELNGDRVLLLEDLKIPDGGFPEFVGIEAEGLPFPGHFSNTNPPYIEAALCKRLADLGVKHLLTNLPSVDREEDGGALAAHRAFWNYPDAIREEATITEFTNFDASLKAGLYFINLQTANIHSDAVPSRPVLYEVKAL